VQQGAPLSVPAQGSDEEMGQKSPSSRQRDAVVLIPQMGSTGIGKEVEIFPKFGQARAEHFFAFAIVRSRVSRANPYVI
jgi:hypothetical protein